MTTAMIVKIMNMNRNEENELKMMKNIIEHNDAAAADDDEQDGRDDDLYTE